MNRHSPRLLAVLFAVLTLVLPGKAQPGDGLPLIDWVLTPGTATADQAFGLSVLSYRYSCAHTYANQSVVVNEGRIDLSFTSAVRPEILCPAIYKPYGPTFRMPALKAGKYAVHMLSLIHI